MSFLHRIIVARTSDGGSRADIDTEREALGKIFGKWIFGSSDGSGRKWGRNEDTSTIMLVWFLTRWEQIADGLFSLGKDCKYLDMMKENESSTLTVGADLKHRSEIQSDSESLCESILTLVKESAS